MSCYRVNALPVEASTSPRGDARGLRRSLKAVLVVGAVLQLSAATYATFVLVYGAYLGVQ